MITDEDIAVDLSNSGHLVDLEELFGRSGKMELEIGSGKGTFLLNQARAHPEVNYLGIEWANKYYRFSVDRMRRWQISNVRILRADAREFIGHYLAGQSVEVLHVYFPDPWPKKRHHKRRFFTEGNMLQVLRILKARGELRVATDHGEYFGLISELLLGKSEVASRFEHVEFFPLASAGVGEWVGSNFERKYLKEGRSIFTLALKKR